MLNSKYLSMIILILLGKQIAAQTNEIERLKENPNYEVKLYEDGRLEVYNKQKNYRYLKTIAKYPENKSTDEANLIIELDTVNAANYDNYYREWGGLPGANFYGKFISIDTDGNGKRETYLEYIYNTDPYNPYSVVRTYEQSQDSLFNFLYEFPNDTLGDIFDVGDITGDGKLDMFCRGTKNNMRFFKQNSSNDLIIYDNFNYNPFPPVYQPNDPTFYDIDGDGNLEIIYFLDAGDGDSLWAYSNHVAKYNPKINNYELIYYNRPQPEAFTSGISTGDFDQDGKGNFATGSIGGKLFIYEFVQSAEYQIEFTKELETYNAYLTTLTDDMDGNGKPEIWIGGDFSSSVYGGVTRLFAFEASSPGIYEQVYQIDIRGLFSTIYGKLRYVDLDGDGIKDLFLTNGNLIFGFKYDGNSKYYMDFVKALNFPDNSNPHIDLERIDIADLDGDGIVEVIPQYDIYYEQTHSTEYYSLLWKRDKITSVDDEDVIPVDYKLYQNYPNPFNPITNIKFSLPVLSDVEVKVFNILGKEIKELLNESRSSGEHEISWNGKDNYGSAVPSGIYFITMKINPLTNETGHFQKTIKAVLLK